ncbi:thiolase C-terminal domain-containing protein [Mycobacterium sp. 663a-19]|uniref:thiolase C-terminal domain-containing protein n=1 Tax=Mycobacterium sp. 663a-19 TaxID=2986148 RepID=UPI003B6329BE
MTNPHPIDVERWPSLPRQAAWDPKAGCQPTPDGGCLARGHAFGATGLAQVAEVVGQLRGEADSRQVADPRVGWRRRWAAAGPA